MRWLMLIVALCCVVITPPMFADECFDYRIELLEIDGQLPQLTADLTKARADVVTWTDTVASAEWLLTFWTIEVARLNTLFYVDDEELKKAQDNVKLYANVVAVSTKKLNEYKQLVDDLENKINQLNQRREYLIIYLEENCSPSIDVGGPIPDPLFP